MNGTATVEVDPPTLYNLMMRSDIKVLRASNLNKITGKQVCLIQSTNLPPGYHGAIEIFFDDGNLKFEM